MFDIPIDNWYLSFRENNQDDPNFSKRIEKGIIWRAGWMKRRIQRIKFPEPSMQNNFIQPELNNKEAN